MSDGKDRLAIIGASYDVEGGMKRIFIKASDKRFKWKFIRDLNWPKDRFLYVQKIKKDQIEGMLIHKGGFVPRYVVTFIPWIPEYGTDHNFGFEMLD